MSKKYLSLVVFMVGCDKLVIPTGVEKPNETVNSITEPIEPIEEEEDLSPLIPIANIDTNGTAEIDNVTHHDAQTTYCVFEVGVPGPAAPPKVSNLKPGEKVIIFLSQVYGACGSHQLILTVDRGPVCGGLQLTERVINYNRVCPVPTPKPTPTPKCP